MKLSKDLQETINQLNNTLPIGKSFDIVTRDLMLGKTKAYWIGINGFCKFEILQQIFSDLQNPMYTLNKSIKEINDYMNAKIGYGQATISSDWDNIIRNILSGPSALFIDGFDCAIILDARSYPTRSIDEPETEKVIKGAKDGFVETMLFNTNLIRRRIRNPQLTFEIKSIGKDSKTDVSIAYVENLVDKQLLSDLKTKMNSIDVSCLTMGSKSLEEFLVKKRWFNFLPNMQSTERPDVACSYLMEGYIIVIVDNSPAVLILPCTFFEFTQSAEDYYKNPVVGTYFRFMRFLCMIGSLFLMPLFMLIAGYHHNLSAWINLNTPEIMGPMELLFYVVIIEFGLDVFKYSTAHTTNSYSGALSIIGGLLVGDIAIELNWASPEVIFYGAITLLTTLTLPSIELGEGIRLYRIFLVILTGFFGDLGFIVGLMLILVSIVTTPNFGRKSYFWPLIPFNGQALKTLLFRYPTPKEQPGNVWNKGGRKERKK